MDKKIKLFYGLKWNPFAPDIPIEGVYSTEKFRIFCRRIEHTLVHEGGFAMISGDPGTGKSIALRLLIAVLEPLRDISVGAITLPSGRLSDFYREMGDLFGVELTPANRWGGFKKLRVRWIAHLEGTLTRAVLLIDEAQEIPSAVLNELRLLSSADFDSRNLLSVVLCGDKRLNEKLRHEDLQPLGSRIRIRLDTEYVERQELLTCLQYLLDRAGNPTLMTEGLMQTLCEHAVGNYRVLTGMADTLLREGAEQDITQLDEKLFLQCFSA